MIIFASNLSPIWLLFSLFFILMFRRWYDHTANCNYDDDNDNDDNDNNDDDDDNHDDNDDDDDDDDN